MRYASVVLFILLMLTQQVVLAAVDDVSGLVEPYQQQYRQTDGDQQLQAEGLTVDSAEFVRQKLENEFWYIVLLSLLCVVSLVTVLSFLKQRDHSSKDIVNAAGLTLIIFGTIILVLIVSTSEQLTAAIGILGAIAGYLFRSVQTTGEESR